MAGSANSNSQLKPLKLKQPIDALLTPFRVFAEVKSSGGILLILATAVALFAANSSYAASYQALWNTKFGFSFGGAGLNKPLLLWINDGLMAMFFFVVGLEIKREILEGELSSPRLAALPIAGAIGGMVIPALFYICFNVGTPLISGWGIPMATDIAFALGILMLLGDRVPTGLKTFLAALAIVDDLGAVLVIALFYTSNISLLNLGIGAGFLLTLIAMNYLGVRSALAYAIVGIGGLWSAFLLSGVHPTVAGVLAALCIPARSKINGELFVESGKEALELFERSAGKTKSVLSNSDMQDALMRMEILCEGSGSPLHRLERMLHPWVMYLVMPVFAFANAGVEIGANFSALAQSSAVWGIVAGLVLGKQLGIFGASWLAVKFGLAALPSRVNWKNLYATAWLGGIGFTMSLFIAGLAFRDPIILDSAKLAILIASVICAVVGSSLLKLSTAATR